MRRRQGNLGIGILFLLVFFGWMVVDASMDLDRLTTALWIARVGLVIWVVFVGIFISIAIENFRHRFKKDSEPSSTLDDAEDGSE